MKKRCTKSVNCAFKLDFLSLRYQPCLYDEEDLYTKQLSTYNGLFVHIRSVQKNWGVLLCYLTRFSIDVQCKSTHTGGA